MKQSALDHARTVEVLPENQLLLRAIEFYRENVFLKLYAQFQVLSIAFSEMHEITSSSPEEYQKEYSMDSYNTLYRVAWTKITKIFSLFEDEALQHPQMKMHSLRRLDDATSSMAAGSEEQRVAKAVKADADAIAALANTSNEPLLKYTEPEISGFFDLNFAFHTLVLGLQQREINSRLRKLATMSKDAYIKYSLPYEKNKDYEP